MFFLITKKHLIAYTGCVLIDCYFANSKWTETDEMTLFAYVCIKTHTCNKVNQAEIFFTDEYTPDDVIVDLYDFIVENRAMISSKMISSDEKIQSMNIRSIDINRFYSPAIPIDYSVVVDVKTDTVHRTFGLIFGRKGGSFFLRSLDEIYK